MAMLHRDADVLGDHAEGEEDGARADQGHDLAEAQPASSIWPVSRSIHDQSGREHEPTTANSTPSRLTNRSSRVPPVMHHAPVVRHQGAPAGSRTVGPPSDRSGHRAGRGLAG